MVNTVLDKAILTKNDLVTLLNAEGTEALLLRQRAEQLKMQNVGNKVYFRGLIEYSNICAKNCYYCGLRCANTAVVRYQMRDEEVLDAVRYAYNERYASLVIQSGEISTPAFVDKITALLLQIGEITNHSMGITLSLGEQSKETLQQWRNAGATRYLLRIETSNPDLYCKIHPNNALHDFENRVKTLQWLRETDYQTGSGVMVGLPFQTIEDLANDLLFFKNHDIDMIGMGPYIEHSQTPLYQYRDMLMPLLWRFEKTLNMIAALRVLMPDINIAASTAMQAIDPAGREKAIIAGANVIMPNLTPQKYRGEYLLYENKPCIDEEADQCKRCLERRILMIGHQIGYGETGDSKHYVPEVSSALIQV